MTKQSVNGIANALVARLIFTGLALRSRTSQIAYRDLIYNLLAFFTLCPALIMLVVASRAEFAQTDLNIRAGLRQSSLEMSSHIAAWVQGRTDSIVTLATLAGTHTLAQMQDRLEQARASDVNFQRIGIRDTESAVVAYSPPIDEFGKSNIGKKFPERPYISKLRETGKPMLAEVVMGRINTPKPIAILLAPILRHGEYGGYVNGVLKLDQIQKYLEKGAGRNATLYTLLDRTGNIILSNRQEQTVMTPLVRGQGGISRMADGVSQWIPALPPNIAIAERWKASFYIAEAPIGDLAEWTLVLEQPVAPFQKLLYTRYAEALELLFLILLVALGLGEYLSRRSISSLEALTQLTHDLPNRLVTQGSVVQWPETGIKETSILIANFKKMCESLIAQFNEVRQINKLLEQRVDERTAELTESEHKLSNILENVDACIYMKDLQGRYLYANRPVRELFGASMDEIAGQTDEKFFDAATSENIRLNDRQVLDYGKTLRTEETNSNLKDGVTAIYHSVKLPLRNSAGQTYALCGVSTDITDRKKMEDQIRQLAYYDPLTKLPNRRLLKDRLRQTMAGSKRSGCHAAMMYLDLDNFKPLNDKQGHGVGDLLLIEVANRLKRCVRETDTVARWGGDEFVVMVSALTVDKAESMSQATVVAEKIRSALSEPYLLVVRHEGETDTTVEHQCTASIGIALFIGYEASQDDIFKWADKAMYSAKGAGRNSIWVYDSKA